MKKRQLERFRRSWGPAGAGRHGRIRQHERGEPFVPPRDLPQRIKSVEQENKEQPIKEAYEGLVASFGFTRPTLEYPTVYFLAKKDGHLNFLDCYKPRYGFKDPKLLEWILAEEDVKIVPCMGCGMVLPLIIKLYYRTGTLQLEASADSYCMDPACYAVTHYKHGPFRHGRIYRGIFR